MIVYFFFPQTRKCDKDTLNTSYAVTVKGEGTFWFVRHWSNNRI